MSILICSCSCLRVCEAGLQMSFRVGRQAHPDGGGVGGAWPPTFLAPQAKIWPFKTIEHEFHQRKWKKQLSLSSPSPPLFLFSLSLSLSLSHASFLRRKPFDSFSSILLSTLEIASFLLTASLWPAFSHSVTSSSTSSSCNNLVCIGGILSVVK